MTILSAISDRLSPSSPSAPVEGGGLPFAGYDRLNGREVVDGLSDHSQVELEAVEGYERSHKERQSVLDKLRYMRQREPLPGYDTLNTEEIATALKEADLDTVKKVRGYERKFANRPDVLEEAVRVLHLRQAAHPAPPAPAYQSASSTSAARPRGRGDRAEKGDGP